MANCYYSIDTAELPSEYQDLLKAGEMIQTSGQVSGILTYKARGYLVIRPRLLHFPQQRTLPPFVSGVTDAQLELITYESDGSSGTGEVAGHSSTPADSIDEVEEVELKQYESE